MRAKDLVRLAQLKVHSYHKKFITDGCTDICNSARQMGLKVSGVVPLPTKRRLVTFMKGPFVNKTAQEQLHQALELPKDTPSKPPGRAQQPDANPLRLSQPHQSQSPKLAQQNSLEPPKPMEREKRARSMMQYAFAPRRWALP